MSLAGTATGALVDKNVGTVKPVVLSGLSLTGSDALNYTLRTNTTAEVLPLAIGVSGYVANDKVYDATTVATVSGAGAISPLAGDVVSLSGGVIGSFADKNVGTGKAVTLGGVSLTGVDAGNYVLSLPTLAAAITPGTLTYLAAPASMFVGQPIPTLTGTVTGFLGSDTLSDATTGNLAFSTSAANVRGAGEYAVTGGGLFAVNYGFVQDSRNATALRVIGTVPPLSVAAEAGVTRGLDPVQRMLQLVEPAKPDPGTSGLAEVVTTPPALASRAFRASIDNATANFAAFNLGAMSAGEIQFLLDARDDYKKSIFAASISKLEADPALADLPPCASLKEAEAGTCLVIESRQRELREALEREQRVAVGTMPPPTQVQPTTTEPRPAIPAAAPAPSPAPAAAPVVAGTTTPPAVETTATVTPISSSAVFSERKRVRSAALPQIERKVAVLIGVGSYKDAVIPSLANSVGDARAMARLFENQLGYETLVLENVGKSQVAAALNRLALELKPHDSVVIYYAGHGELVRSTKLGYWQLADADSQRPETWLSNSDISRIVAAMPSSQVSL
ncbi:MAG TPA: YDG domain-containing protein, partial [Candidatus Limnocylindrales bacterium]|nr:YDG domain-containing protein [Candidatus Limnocylindrales bacterium]